MRFIFRLLTALFIFSFFTFQLDAQHICGLQGYGNCCDGLKALEEDQFTFIPPPEGFIPNGDRDVVISVTYNNFNASQMTAFAYAVDIWASNLTSSVPINVDATMSSLGGGVLGFAGPVSIQRNFTNAPQSNTWYPIALANKLAGFDISGGGDITCTFNTDFNWYYGTDGNTPGGQYDFVSVVLHELCHGLGFVGSGSVSGGLGYIGQSGSPYIYDTFVQESDGTAITSYTSGTSALAGALQSNDLYWNGPIATSANSGTNPRIYAPGSWNGGSSFSHLNESTYGAGNANSLMTPFLGSAEAIHDPGPITYGMFEDMAWTVGGCAITNITAGTQFACDPATNTYTQQIIITYENAPSSGTLNVNGTGFPILTSPQTVTLNGLTSDGQPVNIDADFSTNANCTFSAPALFTAPQSCCANIRLTAADTGTLDVTLENFGSCAVDISNYMLCADLTCDPLSTMTLISGSLLLAGGQTAVVSWDTWVPDIGGTDLSLYIPAPDFLNPDDMVDFTQWLSAGNGYEAVAVGKGIWGSGDFISAISPYFYTGDGNQTGVNFWDGAPTPCTILNMTPGTQTGCDLSDNTFTQQVTIDYINAPSTGTLNVNGQLYPIQVSPQNVILTGLQSNGLPVDVTAVFSADPACTLTINGLFTAPPECVDPCPEDLNDNGLIEIQDLLIFLSDYGCTSNCIADFSGDGQVNTLDILFLLTEFGNSCP